MGCLHADAMSVQGSPTINTSRRPDELSDKPPDPEGQDALLPFPAYSLPQKSCRFLNGYSWQWRPEAPSTSRRTRVAKQGVLRQKNGQTARMISRMSHVGRVPSQRVQVSSMGIILSCSCVADRGVSITWQGTAANRTSGFSLSETILELVPKYKLLRHVQCQTGSAGLWVGKHCRISNCRAEMLQSLT